MNPQDIIGRLLDHLHESQRLIDESRHALPKREHADLIDLLHECEQLTHSQIHLLTRARRRIP